MADRAGITTTDVRVGRIVIVGTAVSVAEEIVEVGSDIGMGLGDSQAISIRQTNTKSPIRMRFMVTLPPV